MSVLFPMAMLLPRAFPPMVSPITIPEMAKLTKMAGREKSPTSRTATTAMVVPEMIPAMSPTTSLQRLETRLAFFTSRTASFPPGPLRAAMEWKGVSLAAVTATPIMSNTMPTKMKIKRIPKAKRYPAASKAAEETRVNTVDNRILHRTTRITQRKSVFFKSIAYPFLHSQLQPFIEILVYIGNPHKDCA